jgi:GNAT superfamily N-acetyltransferase
MICELLGPARSMAMDALRELRPHVDDLPLKVMGLAQNGYRLAGVVLAGEQSAVSVAGFRITENLAWGRHFYVDDLVTREPFRGVGHGRSLLGWLVEQARYEGCTQLHLDSGVGPDRHDAHAAYHAVGLRITSHHFSGIIPADG